MFKYGLWKKWLRHPVLMVRYVNLLRQERKLDRRIETNAAEIEYVLDCLKKDIEDQILYGEGEQDG